MLGRITAIMVKEFIELWRDKSGRIRLVLIPVLQMLAFGYAATFDVAHVSTIVLDTDASQESRDLVARFTASQRLDVVAIATQEADIVAAANAGLATVGLVIRAGFARDLRSGHGARIQVIVDGTNSNSALIALGYIGTIVARYSQDEADDFAGRLGGAAAARPVTVTLEQRPWFNPGLNDRWFFIPGVIGTVTLVLIVNLTAFAVVREREVGTLEQLMVTPIRPAELIAGKTLPFLVVGFVQVALVVAVGTLWFGVPFVGNPLVLAGGTLLFLLSTLALGLLISTTCTTQQQAFATNFIVLNPIFVLSGFAFPIASMPKVLQWLTYLNPLRHFLVVIRGTFLKGVGLDVLWPQFLAMGAIAAVLLTASILRFRKALE
ncbi:ABC transporter permease [Acuticoccus sp. M5D2P5]|uniref:ABC transporter permease n=1 Tax=Acuticoccus kalidii TaxID=2910977 RepID=UPI001F3AE386|nr:ABC transporter permease [Acuticoccus kalidii]MCF3933746.1 ABC transporter permease [Acuticoccus kalidii]